MPRNHDVRATFRAGFTLVELSVVLVIISLLTAGGLAVSTSMVHRAAYIDTDKILTQLDESLRNYYTVNGRLPCPAPIGLTMDDPAFGVEVANCDSGAAISGTFTNAGVRAGMIPVRSLGLTDAAASDKFGDRIIYAVTEAMTDAASFGAATGQISIYGTSDVTPTQTDMAYALYSPGRDRLGGYAFSTGVQAKSCGSAGARDEMNCDFSDASSYRDVPFNNGDQTSTYFDDLIRWAPKYQFMALDTESTSLWAKRADNDNIYSIGADGAPSNTYVGIGTSNPLVPLHIEGTTSKGIYYGRTDAQDARISLADPTQQWSFATGWSTPGDFSIIQEYDGTGLSSGNRFYIQNSTGNVGINTSNPQDVFHVNGTIRTDTRTLRLGPTQSIYGSGSNVFQMNSASDSNWFRLYDNASYGLAGIYANRQIVGLTIGGNYRTKFSVDGLNFSYIYGNAVTNQKLVVMGSNGFTNGAWIYVNGRTAAENPGAIEIVGTTASTSSTVPVTIFGRYDSGTEYESLMDLYANGHLWVKGTTTSPSDARLKKDIEPVTGALDKINAINGVFYRWNGKDDRADTETRHIGVIAQNVREVFPELVNLERNGYLAVNMDGLIPPLIEAVKTLKAQNESLRADVNRLSAAAAPQPPAANPYKSLSILLAGMLLGGIAALLLRRRRDS